MMTGLGITLLLSLCLFFFTFPTKSKIDYGFKLVAILIYSFCSSVTRTSTKNSADDAASRGYDDRPYGQPVLEDDYQQREQVRQAGRIGLGLVDGCRRSLRWSPTRTIQGPMATQSHVRCASGQHRVQSRPIWQAWGMVITLPQDICGEGQTLGWKREERESEERCCMHAYMHDVVIFFLHKEPCLPTLSFEMTGIATFHSSRVLVGSNNQRLHPYSFHVKKGIFLFLFLDSVTGHPQKWLLTHSSHARYIVPLTTLGSEYSCRKEECTDLPTDEQTRVCRSDRQSREQSQQEALPKPV